MKRVAIITDISALGNCSGSAAVSILSHMGIECSLIPTAILSAQTGFDGYCTHDCSDFLKDCARSLQRINPHFDAIYIGFLSNAQQADAAMEFINIFKDSHTLLVTDPIAGDSGKSFPHMSDKLFQKIYKLSKMSDIITPNLTELCLLCGEDFSEVNALQDNARYEKIHDLCSLMIKRGVGSAVVTGAHELDGDIYCAVSTLREFGYVPSKKYGGSYSGTGDIFTSVLLGQILTSGSLYTATAKAAGFISRVLSESSEDITDRNYGIPFQMFLREL